MEMEVAPVLTAMLDEIEAIEACTRDKSFDDFCTEWALRRAVQRAIEIISEASRRLPDELKERHPEIDWARVRGIGNVLRHQYHSIQDEVIWTVVTEHLPPLRAALLDMRDTLSD